MRQANATGPHRPGKAPDHGRHAARPKPGNQPWMYVKPRVAGWAVACLIGLSRSFFRLSHHIKGHGAWQKGTIMGFIRIVKGLDAITADGLRAEQAARLGFLEWALGLDRGAKDAACAALDEFNTTQRYSVAAETFVGFVRLVATTDPVRPLRRGGASARRRTFH